MKTFPLVGLVLAVAASPSLGGELEINLDAASTSVAFTLGATLHTVHGEATVKSGSFLYQPESGTLTGQVVVDAATADTGNKKRDKKMHAKVLLSGGHPRIVLVAQRLDGELALDGDCDVLVRGDIEVPVLLAVMVVSVGISGALGGLAYLASFDGPQALRTQRLRLGGWFGMLIATLLPSSLTLMLVPMVLVACPLFPYLKLAEEPLVTSE